MNLLYNLVDLVKAVLYVSLQCNRVFLLPFHLVCDLLPKHLIDLFLQRAQYFSVLPWLLARVFDVSLHLHILLLESLHPRGYPTVVLGFDIVVGIVEEESLVVYHSLCLLQAADDSFEPFHSLGYGFQVLWIKRRHVAICLVTAQGVSVACSARAGIGGRFYL